MKKILSLLCFIPVVSFANWSENWEVTQSVPPMTASAYGLSPCTEYAYTNLIPDNYDTVEFSLNYDTVFYFAPFGTIFNNRSYNDSYSEPFFSMGIMEDYFNPTIYQYGVGGYISNSNVLKTININGELNYEVIGVPMTMISYNLADGDDVLVRIQKGESNYILSLIVNGEIEESFPIYTDADFDFHFGGAEPDEWIKNKTTPDDMIDFKVYDSKVPEPSSYAVILGLSAICFVVYRRRR